MIENNTYNHMPPVTDEDLDAFADLVVKGEVFTSWEIKKKDIDKMNEIFLPLQYPENNLHVKDGVVFSYYSERTEYMVGDYPSFFTCYSLPKDVSDEIKLLVERKRRYYLSYIR